LRQLKLGLIFVLIFVLVFIISCSNSSQDSKESTRIHSEDITLYENTAMLVNQLEEDLDGDGKPEIIQLYIQPAPWRSQENGELLWDDSQLWQLVVRKEGQIFPLFNMHSRGLLRFWIEEFEDHKNVLLLEEGPTYLTFQSYSYNSKGYFDKQTHYQSEGIFIIRTPQIK